MSFYILVRQEKIIAIKQWHVIENKKHFNFNDVKYENKCIKI